MNELHLAKIGKAVDKALKAGVSSFEVIGYLEVLQQAMYHEMLNEEQTMGEKND